MTLSVVVGTDSAKVLRAINAFSKNPNVSSKPCPYGKGDAGERTTRALKDEL
jgi:UDP-N-acetylglucosamine 2-epimerase